MADTLPPLEGAELESYCSLLGMTGVIMSEVEKAREKFPAPNTTFAAMVEEVGEVGKALMDLELGAIHRDDLIKECVQVAVMAVRIATEGDPGFPKSVVT